MENLAPPMSCIICVEKAFLEGKTLKSGLKNYIEHANDDFTYEIQDVLKCFMIGESRYNHNSNSIYRTAIKELIWSGLHGNSIGKELDALKEEIELACKVELDSFIESIPFRSMIPLLLFQFPAFLLILMGPLITKISESL